MPFDIYILGRRVAMNAAPEETPQDLVLRERCNNDFATWWRDSDAIKSGVQKGHARQLFGIGWYMGGTAASEMAEPPFTNLMKAAKHIVALMEDDYPWGEKETVERVYTTHELDALRDAIADGESVNPANQCDPLPNAADWISTLQAEVKELGAKYSLALTGERAMADMLDKVLAFFTNVNVDDPRELAIEMRTLLVEYGRDIPPDVINKTAVAPLWSFEYFV